MIRDNQAIKSNKYFSGCLLNQSQITYVLRTNCLSLFICGK